MRNLNDRHRLRDIIRHTTTQPRCAWLGSNQENYTKIVLFLKQTKYESNKNKLIRVNLKVYELHVKLMAKFLIKSINIASIHFFILFCGHT